MDFTILLSIITWKDKKLELRRVSSMMFADKLSMFLSVLNPGAV